MKSFVAFLSILALCQGKPQRSTDVLVLHPSLMKTSDQFIAGGTDASAGEFPWQLSVQRQSLTWSHTFGASLLSATYALTAAHCVDGSGVSNIRVVVGIHQQTDLTGTQIVDISSYKMHEGYGVGSWTFPNDIAILTFATPVTIGGNAQPATLPLDNSNSYDGYTCVITGWGSTGATLVEAIPYSGSTKKNGRLCMVRSGRMGLSPYTPFSLSTGSDFLSDYSSSFWHMQADKDLVGLSEPDALQKASIQVLSNVDCSSLMDSVSGSRAADSQICVYDPAQIVGVCGGDNGGPLNCPDDVTRVVGVGSWIMADGLDNCQQLRPSVYTRVSSYLQWIAANTP